MFELAIAPPGSNLTHPPAVAGPPDLLAAFLGSLGPRTLKAYSADLADFARAFGAPSTAAAVEQLLALGQGGANGAALAYRNHLAGRGLATATIARRLAALRSVCALANNLGLVPWTLAVKAPRIEARRDSRGPDPADRKKLWKALKGLGDGRKARRDRALVALLYDLALRRSEVIGLDLADVDLARGTVAVLGKGKSERALSTLPGETTRALREWLDVRGDEAGPLFTRLDRGAAPGRLSGGGLAFVLDELGKGAKVGRKLRPHGLRHAAITAALDGGCDVRTVRRFSRHAKLETVLRYDDAREDLAGQVARKVAKGRG